MFAGLRKIGRDLFTEDDAGSTFCPVRIFGSGGLGTLIGHTAYVAATAHTFDALAFGGGFAAILGAMGLGIGVKAKMGADQQ
jgi:hypothetical protein